MSLPSFTDVTKAAKRLKGRTYPTPLLRSTVIDDLSQKTVWFKPECNQKVGAFKYRGAYNRLSTMTQEERQKGVVAFSSGNHAQGVSRSAKELGISAVIVMPSDAPKIKMQGVINDGAKIVLYDRQTESREEISKDISEREGRIIVPSYDDLHIIAGQGTTGLEIAEEAKAKGFQFDALITPMGGGGLCAGISLAMNELSPKTQIYGAEPEFYNDHQQSIRAGRRIGLDATPDTLCDAVMTPIPGAMPFAINQHSVSDVFAVSDRDCLMAMAIAKKELGIQVEPGGAVGLASVLTGKFAPLTDIQSICVVLSGGNVDPAIADRADQMLD